MSLDRIDGAGKVTTATAFENKVLTLIPQLFAWVEWALFIAGLQFIDQKFGLLPARIGWLALTFLLSIHVGVFMTNYVWRFATTVDHERKWHWRMLVTLSTLMGLVISLGLHQLIKVTIAAQS